MTQRSRAFPFLIGLGVSLGASLMLLLSSGYGPAFAVTLAFALGLGTLRVRHRRIEWLGVRHTLAVIGAVVLGLIFGLTFVWMFFSPYADIAGIAAFITLPGALSGWLGFGFQRWAEKDWAARRRPGSRWNPRSWGIAGVVGLSMVPLSGIMLLWAFHVPHPGPTGTGALIVGFIAMLLLALGLVGLIAEIIRPRSSRSI